MRLFTKSSPAHKTIQPQNCGMTIVPEDSRLVRSRSGRNLSVGKRRAAGRGTDDQERVSWARAGAVLADAQNVASRDWKKPHRRNAATIRQ
jgi:hypothetical protein